MGNGDEEDFSKKKLYNQSLIARSELKALCRERKLAVSGTKAVLIERLNGSKPPTKSSIKTNRASQPLSLRGTESGKQREPGHLADGAVEENIRQRTLGAPSTQQQALSTGSPRLSGPPKVVERPHVAHRRTLLSNGELNHLRHVSEEGASTQEALPKDLSGKGGHQTNGPAGLAVSNTPQKQEALANTSRRDEVRLSADVAANGSPKQSLLGPSFRSQDTASIQVSAGDAVILNRRLAISSETASKQKSMANTLKRGSTPPNANLPAPTSLKQIQSVQSFRADERSSIQASSRKTITSTKRFVTPFKKQINSDGTIDQVPSLNKSPAQEFFTLNIQLEWFNKLPKKLLGYLDPKEQHKRRTKMSEVLDKPSLLSIALNNTQNAKSCLRFLIARLYNKLSTMEEEGCSLDSVLSLNSVIKVESLATGLCCATLSNQDQVCFIANTGEVIGSGINGLEKLSNGTQLSIRNDWQRFIHEQIQDVVESKNLFNCVKTSDSDTYPHGISRHFMTSCKDVELLELAKTYVLANLAPNSTSGRWMSIFESCAEFNGVHVTTTNRVRDEPSELSLFLPSAHHVEKVYLKSESGHRFHEAICAIQTCNRTHICLSLTGQVIGNDEEGVVKLWQDLLGCDDEGVKLSFSKESAWSQSS
ncbi:hypothetical protein CROQUDRAFT_717084 [Cronartium quercuum f. sp. fusiforme G11]|uniref:SAP domain-containing protein n=1 Tax=Cronartium quercuum f. sp. fusiforme G11 TaxID=708437 RepID=A0A9P6NGH3_9BASI|nr:hypothetical protein CROQUDRAFT_717084 [Cronartium quercuum f. sp. fusiforme G11]